MKKALCLLLSLSCANQPSAIHPIISRPITTQEILQESHTNEEQRYQDSLQHIESKIIDEGISLLTCREYLNENECKSLLIKYCEIDTLIDLRGEYHAKTYCKQLDGR